MQHIRRYAGKVEAILTPEPTRCWIPDVRFQSLQRRSTSPGYICSAEPCRIVALKRSNNQCTILWMFFDWLHISAQGLQHDLATTLIIRANSLTSDMQPLWGTAVRFHGVSAYDPRPWFSDQRRRDRGIGALGVSSSRY